MTYTVLNRHGTVQGRGLSARDAADLILSYDGHQYEVRRDGDWCELWVSQFSQNSTLGGRPLVKSVVFGKDEDAIWQSVLTHADKWDGQTCMTDADHEILSKIDE